MALTLSVYYCTCLRAYKNTLYSWYDWEQSLCSAGMKETISAFVNSNCDLSLVSDANIKLLWSEIECGGKATEWGGSSGKGTLHV